MSMDDYNLGYEDFKKAVRDMCFACFVAGKNDMPDKEFEEMFKRLVNDG